MGISGLRSLLDWLRNALPGTSVPAAAIADRLAELVDESDEMPVETSEPTWREKLWTVPSETRIGSRELLEALGRPAS